MTEVTPHPLKTQGFHHFLFYCFTTTRLKPGALLLSLLSSKTEPYRSSRKYARPKLAGGCLSRLLRMEVKTSTITVTT